MMLRMALAGLGDIGLSAHLPAMLRSPEVTLAAVVDPDPRRREIAGIPAYEDLSQLPDDIPAVVLATPPWVTTDAIVGLADRFVLAEKPVATSVAAAEPLTRIDGSRVQVGMTYRHDPAMVQLREWIAGGVLGDRLVVRAHIYDERRDPRDPEHTERIRKTLDHGLPVLHEGSHFFDWIGYLLGGEPRIDDAWSVRTADVRNLTGARLSYPGGHVALIECGWLTAAMPPCELSVLGDRGYAVLDCRTFSLRLSTEDGERLVEFPGERTQRCFDRQLARFVQLVRGKAEASPSLADGLAALRISERVAEASAEVVR
ncbi:Gfo/Idh/MocA family protein [Fodinicola acaciae]|uniref:Gfo/Idh/MocA family protein n=1 Tax=Fodinicola acaciae TaxID=2681555 RepID=UPI0013D0DDF8|nr:Gfo/Idh/MocA family oxidoreductase [Fodinicola acaciae]